MLLGMKIYRSEISRQKGKRKREQAVREHYKENKSYTKILS